MTISLGFLCVDLTNSYEASKDTNDIKLFMVLVLMDT